MIDSISSSDPVFVMNIAKLESNLSKISYLQEQTGVKILHTLKSFHEREALSMMLRYISGFSAGNQNEIDTIDFKKSSQDLAIDNPHIHIYTPAFRTEEIESLSAQATTMSFNSLAQWQKYSHQASEHTSIGIRINPQLNIKQPRYCNPNISNRLGVPYRDFLSEIGSRGGVFADRLDILEGLHFHTLCSGDVANLKYILTHIQREYHQILPRLKWLNLGGGHRLTDETYQHDEFISLVSEFQARYPNLTIILEPGESVVKDTGHFSTTILDIIPHNPPIVILNTSIETHLLDIAITKQTPKVRHTSLQKTLYQYQLSGMSCIAGDDIGTYYFDTPLSVGDEVILEDMIGYSIVKQTQFNGMDRARFEMM